MLPNTWCSFSTYCMTRGMLYSLTELPEKWLSSNATCCFATDWLCVWLCLTFLSHSKVSSRSPLWLLSFIHWDTSMYFCAAEWFKPAANAVQSSSGSLFLYNAVPGYLKKLLLPKSWLLFTTPQQKTGHHSLKGMKIWLLLWLCCGHSFSVSQSMMETGSCPRNDPRNKRRADTKSTLW